MLLRILIYLCMYQIIKQDCYIRYNIIFNYACQLLIYSNKASRIGNFTTFSILQKIIRSLTQMHTRIEG